MMRKNGQCFGMGLVRAMLVGAVLGVGAVPAAASVVLVGNAFPTDVSADGRVVVGNTADIFETFRYTEADNLVRLGRATVPVISSGAGAPKVSADGKRISATIMDDTDTVGTLGRWTEGSGWEAFAPPLPPDGGILDNYYGSAFGISGDGNTVLGLYWRPGQTGGLAHAAAWKPGASFTGLGSSGGSSRVEASSFDGSVIVGWDEHPTFGNRRAAVWENGVKTVFDPTGDGPSELHGVTPDGGLLVGDSYDYVNNYVQATTWKKQPGGWTPSLLGLLPGTDPVFGGFSTATDVSADGSVVVGLNRFGFFGGDGGFVWTESGGMVLASDWLNANGAELDPNFYIQAVSAVSDDGKTFVGYGYFTTTFASSGFIISIPEPATGAVVALGAAMVLRRRR